jgi:hypothetical protein
MDRNNPKFKFSDSPSGDDTGNTRTERNGAERSGAERSIKNPPLPPSGDKGKVAKTKTKEMQFNLWGMWIDCHREIGMKDPARIGKDLNASKPLSQLVTNGDCTVEELKAAMILYLKDGDSFISRSGHPLSLLPGKINSYLDPAHRRASGGTALSEKGMNTVRNMMNVFELENEDGKENQNP